MAYTVPYQAGMSLGRTFDVQHNTSGTDIFSGESTSNLRTIDSTRTSIAYKVIKSSQDVRKFLNISGNISLRIKAGFLRAEGMCTYLRDDKSEDNSLEILAKAQVETVTETLTSSQPIQNWRRKNIGTHYVRSITYGGEMFARISIRGSDSEHLREIKEAVEANINPEGVVALDAKQSFKKMEQELKKSSKIDICYYCTGFGGSLPKDIDGMFKALEDFPNQMRQINNGKGVPLRCELVSLAQLEPDVFELIQQNISFDRQNQLEEYYDDIRQAQTILKNFSGRDDVNFTDEQMSKAKEIENRLDDTLQSLNDAISMLDVTSDEKCKAQMKTAIDIYKKYTKQGGFRVEVRRFISQVEPPKKQILKEFPQGQSLNIVLLGKTGHGKSATGNSIFGDRKKFREVTSTSSVTHKCKLVRGKVGGRIINLVDTPGTMDTDNIRLSVDEIGTAIACCSEGYHAFLLILRFDVRMTKEEWGAIKLLQQLFGPQVLEYSVIVFTHGDEFFKNENIKEKTILEYLQNQNNKRLNKLVTCCNNRCCIINNREKDIGILREQVIEIITSIDKVIDHNDMKMYTNDLFKYAQTELNKERKNQELTEGCYSFEEQEELDDVERGKDSKQADCELLEERVGRKVGQKVMDSGMGCFPPDALIRLQDGRKIQMADLRVGEKILSFVSSGKLEYSEVYFFAHLDPTNSSQYIIISTLDHKLKLTLDHHIYTVDIGGYLNTVPARKIKEGDRILFLDEATSSLKEEVVTNLSESIEVGIYAPITMAGTIIVDEVLVSCYVDIVPPKFSHSLLWPLRQLYRMSPSLSARINTLGKSGIPAWTKFIMNNLLRWRK